MSSLTLGGSKLHAAAEQRCCDGGPAVGCVWLDRVCRQLCRLPVRTRAHAHLTAVGAQRCCAYRVCMCMLHSFNSALGSMLYNFLVTPPSGVEYPALMTPSLSSSLVLTSLPVGFSGLRVVATDAL